VWCGVKGESVLTQQLRSIHSRLSDKRLTGKFRYRVVRQAGTAVDLQWVKRAHSLTIPPDMLRVPMVPGVSGVHATLSPGCIVYVEFVDGLRDDPIITGFEGRGGNAAVPQMLEIGGENGANVACQGDTVTSPLPPMVVNGTMIVSGVPTPFTAVMIATTGQILGSITTGRPRVKVGNG
jgi:hypothetical protein